MKNPIIHYISLNLRLNYKLHYLCVGLLTFCFALSSKAQHDPQYSQFMFNKILYNPGFTGIDEVLNASFMGRNQWMGFDGQPVTQSVCVDAPIPTGGLGLVFSNDVSRMWFRYVFSCE